MISIIIPTLNEERALPHTLRSVFDQPGEFEVIVVDGGSSDQTRAVVEVFPGVRWQLSAPGRGVQMNAGARAARGELLLFLHADTTLPRTAIPSLNALERNTGVQAGCFRHRFSGCDWRLRMISRLHNWRCRMTKIIYGDQAMFVRRKLFAELGGFPESLLEDVRFSQRLRSRTRPRLLDVCVTTDSRKFVTMGVWRSLWRVVIILLSLQLRLPPPRAFFANIR